MQSDTLSAVFETYFRILKRSMELSVSRLKPTSLPMSGGFGTHPLLAPCLNGLGKFSHLIDLDFMGDLMTCLKRLAGYSENHDGPPQNCLSVSERFQCCIVAFRVMRNNLDALNVDLQEFFVQLYNLMLEYRPGRDHGNVLSEALKTMLWEGKQHDMQRAAAFIKRLATFALSFGSTEAIAALVTLKHLLQKNSKCRCLLENDAGGGSLSGLVVKYQPDASDPNLSGALASVLWELNLLSRHYNPTISSMASSISSMGTMNPSQNQSHLSTTSPVQAFRDLSIEQELSMPISKPSSTQNRKRKGEKPFDVASRPERIWETGRKVHEDEVKNKLENHFKVLRDIEENERLRAELNRTLKSISIY
ncbi:nucleolar complex protein 3-like protein [Iris pallida]|uniref:Nucleolar complex protein 3-like protein n=1 Tax=Iris pallida TaxID=29817 RepID=A0AAX6FT38_IRIPA|nr:nucleolar complex protein 3-like protein [Iris pallida]